MLSPNEDVQDTALSNIHSNHKLKATTYKVTVFKYSQSREFRKTLSGFRKTIVIYAAGPI